MRPSRQARLQLSGIGPVEPLTRAAKEALRSAVATARVVSAERMKVLLVGLLTGLGVRPGTCAWDSEIRDVYPAPSDLHALRLHHQPLLMQVS